VQIPQSGNWNITSPSGSLSTLPRPITDGVLTFTAARTGTVQIVGAQRPRRLSEFGENRGVAARDLNQVLNGIEAQLREMWDRRFRTIQAPPGETLNLLPVLASRLSQGACFDSSGNLTSCVSVPSSTFATGNGILFSGVSPTTITNNIAGGPNVTSTGTNPLTINVPLAAGNGIVLSGTNPVTISVGGTMFVPARAAAAALNLSTYSVIETGGYATAGDGGGAIFKNVGSTSFIDSFLLSGSITNQGSGGINGTYNNVNFAGGSGVACFANITVATNKVTAVALINSGAGCGTGYVAGDVLTISSAAIGNTVGFQYTVSTVSAPLASFTDSAGTHWQYIVDKGNFINVKQFGAAMNWLGSDGGATNDLNAIQAAMNFAAAFVGPSATSGGVQGSEVLVPKGSSLVCGGLLIPDSVILSGLGAFNSALKLCDTGMGSNAHFVSLCNSTTHTACFGSKLQDIGLFATSAAAANSSIAMVYSNNVQQLDAVERVAVYTGSRNCMLLETGFGGAAYVGIKNLLCTITPGSVNTGIIINYGTTIVSMRDIIVESPGTAVVGMLLSGGQISVDGFPTEGVAVGIAVLMATPSHFARINNASGGGACTSLIQLKSGNTLGNTVVGTSVQNGCSNNVEDAQPSGVNVTTTIVSDRVFNP
jgi:hypothetical protein